MKSLSAQKNSVRQVKILDAAAQAFTKQGYAATTLDCIGDVIGATKGNVYYYYRSKADLFLAVHRFAMELNINTITPLAKLKGTPPSERLYRMVHKHTIMMMTHYSYQRVTVQGLELHLLGRTTEKQRAESLEIVNLRDAYEKLFLKVIREGIVAGEFRKVDARLITKPVLGALNWTTMWYRPKENESKAHRIHIATQISNLILGGLLKSQDINSLSAFGMSHLDKKS